MRQIRRCVVSCAVVLLVLAPTARAFSASIVPLRGMSSKSSSLSPRGHPGGSFISLGPGQGQGSVLTLRGGRYGSLQMQQQTEDKVSSSDPDGTSATDQGAARAPGALSEATTPAAWGIIALLLAANVHNQWTRALVYYLVSFKEQASDEARRLYMNVDLGFDETQYSLLASFGFTTFFTICSLIAGRAADSTDRARIVALAAVAWSLATVGQGMADSFDYVLAGRAMTGVAQAFLTPAAFGLIADVVPAANIATANSVYSSGVYLGGALASLSILLDNALGWRSTSLLAGGIGLGIGGMTGLFLRDSREPVPLTKGSAAAMPGSTELGSVGQSQEGGFDLGAQAKEALGAITTVLDSNFVRLLFVASAFRFCAGYGIGVWKAPFFREAFPGFQDQFSVANAFVISGGGVLSSVLGGYLSDKLAPKDERARLWIPAAGCLLAVPLWVAVCQSTDFYTSIGLLFGEYIVAECWFGPVLASLYGSVPRSVQGTSQGLFTVVSAIGNLMPVLIGALQKDGGLSSTLAWTVSGAYALSAVFFMLAAEQMPRAPVADSPDAEEA